LSTTLAPKEQAPAPNVRMKLGTHSIIWKTSAQLLKHQFKFQLGDSLNMVDLQYRSQLHEGLRLEKEGAWFELFLYDHVNHLYAVERIS
jgi:hypothetical protein